MCPFYYPVQLIIIALALNGTTAKLITTPINNFSRIFTRDSPFSLPLFFLDYFLLQKKH